MKNFYLFFLILAIFISCLSACNTDHDLIFETPKASLSPWQLQADADSLLLSVDKFQKLSDNDKKERKYGIIMAEHTILQDSGYYIDISEIEAIKLGIPSHFYYASINHLETINEQIKTSIKKGSKISLINIKDTISKRKANINNKPSFSRGIYDPEVGIGGLTSSNCRIDSLFATHRSSESFIGTLVASIFTENWDPKIIFGSITTEAISPNFTDREYRTIENESRYYHFRLKVKPTSLDRSYIITYLSYPCTSSDAHWYNFLIGPPQ